MSIHSYSHPLKWKHGTLDPGHRLQRRLSVVVLVLFLISVGLSWSCAAENWAVVIGISEYADPAIVPLYFAATDAQEVAQTFVEHCAVPEQNLTVLLNEEATRVEVLSALDRVNRDAAPSDRVFFYVAGHGATTPDLDGDEADGDRLDEALLVYDSIASDPDTYILDDTLGIWMEQTDIRSVAVFFDSCHSGGQSRSLDTQATSPATSATFEQIGPGTSDEGDTLARDLITSVTTTSRGILAACGPREMAYESRGLGHGVFTHFLIAALKDPATDLDLDGTVLMDELGAVVIESVTAWGQTRSEKQTPVLEQVRAANIVIVPERPGSSMAIDMLSNIAEFAPLEGFVGVTKPAPISLTTEALGTARRFRFPVRFEDGVEIQIVPGGIAPMDGRWVTIDPTTGYVYAVSPDAASASALGRVSGPVVAFAIQSGILYASFSPETNALTTYDLLADFAPREQILAESLPFDNAELTGVSISGSTLSLIGWSGGIQMLIVYDLHNDCLTFATPIAGSGCVGLVSHRNALYSLDPRHGFLVQLVKYDDQPEIGLTFVTDLNARVPDGWLPYDPRGEQIHLGGFYFTDTHLLLSTSISEGIDVAELFEIALDAPLVGSGITPMAEPDAFAPVGMTP